MMVRYLGAENVAIYSGDEERLHMLSSFTYDPAARAYVLRAPRSRAGDVSLPRLVSPLRIAIEGNPFALLHFETEVRVPVEIAFETVHHEQEAGDERRRRPSTDLIVSEVAILYGPLVEMLNAQPCPP